jgi:hypothetical protein
MSKGMQRTSKTVIGEDLNDASISNAAVAVGGGGVHGITSTHHTNGYQSSLSFQ